MDDEIPKYEDAFDEVVSILEMWDRKTNDRRNSRNGLDIEKL